MAVLNAEKTLNACGKNVCPHRCLDSPTKLFLLYRRPSYAL